MKGLRSHGFSQRASSRLWATWSGTRRSGPAGPQGHHVHEPLLLGRLRVQRGLQPAASAAHGQFLRKASALFYRGQGRGNRFGEDDLAGDPEADALTNNGQGPPSITGRLRSAADGGSGPSSPRTLLSTSAHSRSRPHRSSVDPTT